MEYKFKIAQIIQCGFNVTTTYAVKIAEYLINNYDLDCTNEDILELADSAMTIVPE